MQGGCQCGELRYEVTGEPVEIYVCHCRECQAQSASAFGISVIVRPGDLRLLSGQPVVWSRPASRRGTLDCFFCPTCGTRIWHGNPERDDRISVKGGSLDQKPDISGAKHIWTSRKMDGVIIPPGAKTYDTEAR